MPEVPMVVAMVSGEWKEAMRVRRGRRDAGDVVQVFA